MVDLHLRPRSHARLNPPFLALGRFSARCRISSHRTRNSPRYSLLRRPKTLTTHEVPTWISMGRVKTVSDAKLLEVARRAFVKEGFSASTKTIARRAGVSEGVLFQRFTTKQDLFFAAMIPPPADLNEIFHHPNATGFDLFAQITLS